MGHLERPGRSLSQIPGSIEDADWDAVVHQTLSLQSFSLAPQRSRMCFQLCRGHFVQFPPRRIILFIEQPPNLEQRTDLRCS